ERRCERVGRDVRVAVVGDHRTGEVDRPRQLVAARQAQRRFRVVADDTGREPRIIRVVQVGAAGAAGQYATLVLADGEARLHLPLPRETLGGGELDALVSGVEVLDVVTDG